MLPIYRRQRSYGAKLKGPKSVVNIVLSEKKILASVLKYFRKGICLYQFIPADSSTKTLTNFLIKFFALEIAHLFATR